MKKQAPAGWSAGFRSHLFLFGLVSCLIAVIANNGIMWLTSHFSLGLYLDTVFTVAVTFLAGLAPGIICAILTTFVYSFIYYLVWGVPYYWGWYFYILCSIAAVLLVEFFARYFEEEYKRVRLDVYGRDSRGEPRIENVMFSAAVTGSGKQQLFAAVIMLAIISAAMCVLISIIGGLVSTFINVTSAVVPEDVPPETWLRMGFLRQGFSLSASEILSRIPINMADRPISVFAGYGIAFLVKKFLTRNNMNPNP